MPPGFDERVADSAGPPAISAWWLGYSPPPSQWRDHPFKQRRALDAMTASAALQILPVENRTHRRAFLALPARLYRDDPHWIAPLRVEEGQRVFGNNPLFEHAEARAWLAWRDGRPVGRITAQIDRLQQEVYREPVGLFGMLEAEDDPQVFAALFAAAEAWLRSAGCTRVLGPFNLSINEEIGLLVEGFDAPPFVMMGHARRYYPARVLEQGYGRVQELLTYTIAPDFPAPTVMTRLAERVAGEVHVRALRRKELDAELEILRDLFNDAWANNWGFVPFTAAEFRALGRMLAVLLPDDLVQIAELHGRPVAFMVALPNVNEAARDLGEDRILLLAEQEAGAARDRRLHGLDPADHAATGGLYRPRRVRAGHGPDHAGPPA